MNKRRLERVAVTLLSISMLLSSTGIMSSLAANAGESSSVSESAVSESVSTAATQESSSAVSEASTETTTAPSNKNGEGTVENPYRISNAEEFLGMNSLINVTSSANKYFVLTADIDLSSVTEETIKKKGGSLVSVNKSLAKSSENVYFVLDGQGHKLKGLNIKADSSSLISIFGTVNAKSVIKNIVVEKPHIVSTSESLVSVSTFAFENKGTITGVKITYPVITASKSSSAAFVASVNDGTISNVSVTSGHTTSSAASADNHTISALGTVGAIASVNNGTITSASAVNIGMFIPAAESNVIYGGIAGRSSGTVSNSVSTGNVFGGKSTDAAGGIVGKAQSGLKLVNNYTLVTLTGSVQRNAVIGVGGTADMIKDCFWSSSVSGCGTPVTGFGSDTNNLLINSYRIVPVGKNAEITSADAKKSVWGKAVFALNGAFSTKSGNVSANADSTAMTVKGETVDAVSKINYTAAITLPADVGAGASSVTVKQYMHIYALTVGKDTVGDGTKDNPLEISTAAEFAFIGNVPDINCKLTKDIKINSTVGSVRGVFDGNGHTITTSVPVFGSVYGTVKNVNVTVTKNISHGVFTNIIGAAMSNVDVTLKDGVKLLASASNTGLFADKIFEKCVLDNCRVKGGIEVQSEKVANVGGFAGAVTGEGTSFTNSGAAVSISVKEGGKNNSRANFIGRLAAENVAMENCYAAGANTAGGYMFIGSAEAKTATVKNIYIDYSDVKGAASKPLDFSKLGGLVKESEFTEWKFEDGTAGFFTGSGSNFAAKLPALKAIQSSTAADYKLSFDNSKIKASASVADGRLVLSISRANGVVTVKAIPVTVTNTKTGLSATIHISNGLEKDSAGNWMISTQYDLAYVGENIAEMANDKFVVTKDIDMSDINEYLPIGSTAVAFSGVFDGNGHTISNLTVNGTAKTALFGSLSDATVKNIVFKDATVTSRGGYAAVLAGQATGKTVITGITVENSKINVSDNYAAVIAASVDNATGVSISDITVKNCSIKSNASYVGAVAGRVTDNTAIANANVSGFKASGANYVGGIAGLAQGDAAITISNVKVDASDISGVSEISGIASGIGKGTAINKAEVKNSKVYTVNGASSFVAGGISAVYGSTIENASVEAVEINAGIAGGVVGKTSADCALVIKNADVKACAVSASGDNTAAAGILGVHNVKGSASVQNSTVSEDTIISSAALTAGIAADCSGAESTLEISGVKTFAKVVGSDMANAVSAAGALGRIGTSAINGVAIKNTVIGGEISGNGVLGGIIGLVKGGEAYNGKAPVAESVIAYPQINSENAQSGMIIGAVESVKVITSKDLDKAVKNVIISTYYGDTAAYSAESGLAGGGFTDMDKPNGEAITSSVPVIIRAEETPVSISNLPKLDGFKFDAKTGWTSESDERIQVVSCTENTAVLKANHMADISVVGYYVLGTDSQVRVPVHFREVANIRTPLKGNGTKAEPYLVTCAYDLETVAQYANENVYFALTDDIVFKAEDFEFGGAFYNVGSGVVTIGDVTNGFKGTFTGLYNGKVHSITGLAISGNAFGGLFGAADGAVITDLVINNAAVSGRNYSGVVVGSAKNTTIKNITINSASVEATQFGGYVGTVVGCAEGTTIENVTVNGAEVRTIPEINGAAIEAAGGIAGVFDGTISDVEFNGISVESTSIAGGAVGMVRGEAELKNISVDASVKGEIAGGVAGRIDNPLKVSIDGAFVKGTVEGTKTAAGVIGKVNADSADYSLSKAKKSLVADTVVAADIAKADINGVIIGDASANVFVEKENINTDVFENVFYSSYQNGMGIFGSEEINAYQISEYAANDLSDMKFAEGEAQKDYIPFISGTAKLDDSSIKLNGADGSYKAFTAAGRSFELQSIEGAVSYSSADSVLTLASGVESTKVVFVYNDGLELAMDAKTEDVPEEPVIPENAVDITCEFKDSTDGALGSKLIAVMLKSKDGNAASSFDYFTRADAKAKQFGTIVVNDGLLYVNAELPKGFRFTVKAVDESGREFGTADVGNEGILVQTGDEKNIRLVITAEKDTEETWGLRSVWSVIGK